MLKKQEPYNHDLYKKSDLPPVNRVLTTDQALAFLRAKGYVITGDLLVSA